MSKYSTIIKDGLWNNNVGLVQLLGLCPLLAVTGTVINGLALGIATMVTVIMSNIIISSIRNIIKQEIRIPVFILIIACIVTIIEFSMQAWLPELFLILGIFIPLIVTNCSVIGRAEAFAAKNPIVDSAVDGFFMGLGFLIVLVLLGAVREVIGTATLFDQMHLLFGESARSWAIHFSDEPSGFLLAILPPGAFFGLGALIVIKNIIDKKIASKEIIATQTEKVATA
jgi:electron transport complex protein RnfE